VSGTRKRGRPPNAEANGKVHPTIAPGVMRHLETLARDGSYGGQSPSEVAAYLIMREIDDLIRAGVLSRPTPI
jgi:hypothetical protein